MSLVTSGAETWAPHTHRNHHGGGTIWINGPDVANVTGTDSVTTPAQFGNFDFLFWSASGTSDGDLTYDPGVTTPAPPPTFPSGSDPGSVIAWYLETGGVNGGPPGLVFDAFNESAGDWLDWDHTNDPFTVTSGTRLPGPDDDDEVVTTAAAGTVVAEGHFPGTGLIFDRWLVFGADTHVDMFNQEQVTEAENSSGYAIAVYVDPTRKKWNRPQVPAAYDPWWWLKNSPVESFQQQIRVQGEAAQIASLIDASTAMSRSHARAMVQHGLYEALISVAHEHLNASSLAKEEAAR
jgi:hypothetical protein